MANFPVLSTGAVTQYPAACAYGRLGQAIRFLDGSGQRFIARGPMLRRWLISLDLLNELELSQIEQFFSGGRRRIDNFPISRSILRHQRFQLQAGWTWPDNRLRRSRRRFYVVLGDRDKWVIFIFRSWALARPGNIRFAKHGWRER